MSNSLTKEATLYKQLFSEVFFLFCPHLLMLVFWVTPHFINASFLLRTDISNLSIYSLFPLIFCKNSASESQNALVQNSLTLGLGVNEHKENWIKIINTPLRILHIFPSKQILHKILDIFQSLQTFSMKYESFQVHYIMKSYNMLTYLKKLSFSLDISVIED